MAPPDLRRPVVTTALRWALIGASDIASTRVVPAMRALGHSVDAVYSGSAERAQRYAADNGIAFGSSDLAELLALDIDAVYVSSHNDLHHSQAIAAIAAGKHVLCEKPLALSIDDAENMVAAADEAGVVLAVNHHLPFSPVHQRVRELVQSGAIGKVLSVRIGHAVLLPERLRGWRTGGARGGGVALDITCHDASVLNPLLGRARRVTALGVKQGPWAGDTADAIMTVIEYDNDGDAVIAQTHDAFTIAFDTTSFTVHGSEGSLFGRNAMTQDSAGTLELVDESGRSEVPLELGRNLYEIILTAFAAATRGEGAPTVSGRDGVETLRVALAAQESITTGQTIHLC
ncbi:Gfo/Idh/MocA family oxidoreductase [Microbacterium sp. BWT-B31]|uniref:Gfo/Idh/MocA family protein n=1 Tax=Microbacterium sp. BWT-B31 TaxID=3232072 RepID=UPI0035299B92